MADTANDQRRIVRRVGVYDADHTIRGEVAYWVGARFGRRHCSLCEITHGLVRERTDWRTCREEIGVPFTTFHRDDQPDSIRIAAGNETPVVVAVLADETTVVLLRGPELEGCGGSPDALVAAIEAVTGRFGLTLG
jgi:hypothetical protein